MAVTPQIICLVIAIVLFAIGAFINYRAHESIARFSFISAGLFFYALKDLFQ